jgi:hypothetical protein
MLNPLIEDFKNTHRDGYLISWLTPLQLDKLDALLRCRRGDVSVEYFIEQVLYFMDIN